MIDTIMFIIEIIGMVAFAISGAAAGIKAKFDVFGVVAVGSLTCIGGGITRDLLIGTTPPVIFSRWYMVAIAALVSLIFFIFAYVKHRQFRVLNAKIEQINNFFDALGLAAFTVMGMEVAFAKGLQDNAFLAISLGLLTGVGGGVLRDILTEVTPYIFKKHIYALASILGAVLYYVLRLLWVDTIVLTIASMAVVFAIRLLATRFRWSLPKVHLDEEEEEIEN